jgi:hypothetical protein
MTDTDKLPFDALGHTLVIGSCRTGKTRIPLLHTGIGLPFKWQPTQGAYHSLLWAPSRVGMSCVDDRSGGFE